MKFERPYKGILLDIWKFKGCHVSILPFGTTVVLPYLWFFQWSCMDVRVGLWRKLHAKELMLLNCGVREDFWEFLGLQGDPTSPFWRSVLKDWSKAEGLMVKLKLQYIGHLMRRVDSLEKTDAGRDWGQEEKGTTEDEMTGWHHRLNGHEFGWTLGVGDGQGGLACCNSWSRQESDTTERLNWTDGPLMIAFLSSV